MNKKNNSIKRSGLKIVSGPHTTGNGTENRDTTLKKHSYSFKARPDSVKDVKKKQRKSRLNIRLVTVMTLLVSLVIVCVVLYEKLCIISQIKVINCDVYTNEEVIEHSNITLGSKLFDISQKEVNSRLCNALPYIKKVNLVRKFPDTVEIHITKENPSAYVSVGGEYYIVSDDLKVLKRESDKQKVEDMKLMHVYTSKVKSCIVGEKLVFTDEDMQVILNGVITNLKEAGIVGFCDELDIRNKFEVSFLYKNSFVVKLGEGLESKLKINYMKQIAQSLTDNDSGIIDVSDIENNQGSFIKK